MANNCKSNNIRFTQINYFRLANDHEFRNFIEYGEDDDTDNDND